MPIFFLNDGTANPPRLRYQHSLWGLRGLPISSDKEWTLDEKFERVRQAGFEAVECWLTDENEKEHAESLSRHGLRLVLGHRPFTLDDIHATVRRAQRLQADFLFMQPADAFTSLDDVVRLVVEGRKAAADAGLPLFVEIHRNNFTETIPQTLALIQRVPDILFTADLSHLVLVGEFYGWEQERAEERMMPILERTAHIHGRVSSGEQIQVDVADGSTAPARFFVRLWSIAMRAWLRRARPGDLLPFTPELGPPRYAITLPDGREFSDRWEQSLVMRRLADEAWAEATASA